MENVQPVLIDEIIPISKAEFVEKRAEHWIGEKPLALRGCARSMYYVLKICSTLENNLHAKLLIFKDSKDVNIGVSMDVSIKSDRRGFSRKIRRFEDIFDNPLTTIHDCYDCEKEERSVLVCCLADLPDTFGGKFVVRVQAILSINFYEKKIPSPLTSALWACENRDFVIAVGKECAKEKTEIKVHKLVLCVRSHVFNRMLKTDMAEKMKGKVEIVDFESEVVQTSIDFCYDHDNLNAVGLDTLIGILQFADKYDIKDLQAKVEHALKYQIFPNTICKIANASMSTNSELLKKFCCQFLKLYIKNNIAFDDSETLDKDFAIEMIQSASGGSEDS